MKKVRLGRTNLMVTKPAFGVLPLQRVEMTEAVGILRNAYESGINFFDTARAYTDSEEKIGNALSDVRKNIVIATKTQAKTKDHVLKHLEKSLKMLKTDYIDIYQLHNHDQLPGQDDPGSIYRALLDAKASGVIRHIGITNHRRKLALEAIDTGMFDTLQFPFSLLATKEDIALVEACKKKDVGFIAMKALSGGLISNIPAAVAFLNQYENVVPIWGIQRKSELDQFIELAKNPPFLDEAMQKQIEKDRVELAGNFCRGCGYCMPCPVEIPINTAARLSLMLMRAPVRHFLSDAWYKEMMKIEDCTDCGSCKEQCPYELDTPELLRSNLKFYKEFYEKHKDDRKS
ncbi:MAG: aldo/keto reductase [Deltaproteobacteria bacterium]|nr:aldo/keto reductase [Deltaproteobacteria bacterium]